ncbi:hypothetical protein JMI89_08470 [Frischella sp. Ac48]|uniref:LXG domain-containing protein n=1 Tax=Frischella japonica TaxID=2741544 RepID=A0ABR7QX51_9GAMM|nr:MULTISPECIES: hypothetical protein [Frischella]MBC9130780.1 hypothetical protein [Frischella japonica]MBX4133662.1 hypothetical protein [Frischella sp. Ac48]
MVYQLQKINEIANKINDKLNKIDSAVNSAYNVVDLFGNQSGGIAEQFVIAMDTLVNCRQLATIETRFKSYNNIMISFLPLFD